VAETNGGIEGIMPRYRCPSCSQTLDVKQVYDGRWLVKCDRCSLGELLANPDAQEAYLEFLEGYDEGRIRPGGLERLLEQGRLVRPAEEILKMVSGQGVDFEELPELARYLLKTRMDFVVDYRYYPPNDMEGRVAFEEVGLPAHLSGALGCGGLYPFQAEAAREILAGRNVVIVAPAGSGKTEAFAIPTAYLSARSRVKPSALIFYPTKALARDQLPRLRRIGEALGASVAVYDGDTPAAERRRLEEDPPHIILTNFDTVNTHLIYQTPFAGLLRRVQTVVVDEVQVYKGVLGAHVHHILRRLRRISGHFQSIAASNMIKNPVEFCKLLFDQSFHLVEERVGRRGPTHFIALYPTLRSATELFLDIMGRHRQSDGPLIVFCSSHRLAETLAFYARRGQVDAQVHRAGLPRAHRERVEALLRARQLKCVIATPTLELGIDIGELDTIVSDLVVVNRLIQRAGRAGRRGQTSTIVLIMRANDPIGQYYRDHIEQYFSDIEAAYLDPSNPLVLEKHMLASALERPLDGEEADRASPILSRLAARGLLRYRAGRWVANRPSALAALRNMDIRGAGEAVRIYLRGRRVGERSLPMALEELHPGAVYFMNGRPYRSIDLTLGREGGKAVIQEWLGPLDYTTRAIIEERPSLRREIERREAFSLQVVYGELTIERRVLGYVEEPLEAGGRVLRALPKPIDYVFETKGLVTRLPEPTDYIEKRGLDPREAASSSYHAAEHVLIEGTDMVTGGAADDMGGLSLGATGLVFVYDGTPGGNGATHMLFQRLEEAIRRAAEIVRGCACSREAGCPRCTYSYRCGNDNRFLSRVGAAEVYRRVLAGERGELDLSIIEGSGWR